jgi:hypothetical protein
MGLILAGVVIVSTRGGMAAAFVEGEPGPGPAR